MKIVKLLLLIIVGGCAAFITIKHNFDTVDFIALYAIAILPYIAGGMINFFE